MTEEAGTVSKSAAKNAKDKAGKVSKKRPDPEGLALIAKADAAFEAKDFGTALELYQKAKDICDSSTVEVAAKEKKPKPEKTEKASVDSAEKSEKSEKSEKAKLVLRLPKENLQAKPLREGVDADHNYALNSVATLESHLGATKGSFLTRFPPEPNGYLHIGHAKAMNFNFGQARLAREGGHGGETIMRFDDTNPTAEKQEFIDSILDNVAWLGHSPVRVTYSSDYFKELHALAVQLIKVGGAYVCHQTADEIKEGRNKLKLYHSQKAEAAASSAPRSLPEGALSPWRDRSVAENLRHFERMRQGRYAEGEAFLRMKTDPFSDNTSLWDPAAYRVMFHAHPRTGDDWCIYPTYDYTHCIVDSLENITHSLCTLEFEVRQACDGPYYWLLDALKLYKPTTWEYSRLNLTHNLMSKRKLKYLVNNGHVLGWDDPRLVTLDGLRRRGFSAAVINRFCEEIGVTRAKMTARWGLLEQISRLELDEKAPRRFAVLEPLRVTLTGLAEGKKFVSANHPKNAEMGSREMLLTAEVYIERSDFRMEDDANFFGLAPGKEVGLLGAGVNIKCGEVTRDACGEVVALTASVDASPSRPKVKGHLHWVSAATAVPVEVRVYGVLFTPEDPEAAAAEAAGAEPEEEEGDEEATPATSTGSGDPAWIKLLNPSSLVTYRSLVEPSLAAEAGPPNKHARPTFQFQRLGYFCVDTDSTKKAPVFNRVVALKEDREKKAA